MTSVDDAYRLLAARYLDKQLTTLTERLKGVRRADDVEYIHKSRVASRRIRAALNLFGGCFEPETVQAWRRAARKLTKGLGGARDKDVQIAFLCGTMASLEDESHIPGVARLLVRLERKRDACQPRVLEAIDQFQASEMPQRMPRELGEILADLDTPKATVTSRFSVQETRARIQACQSRLTSQAASLEDPSDSAGHHALRIVAKRLRYTMEISNPVYGGGLQNSIEAVSGLQSLLGDLHDCDVWETWLVAARKKEAGRAARYYATEVPMDRLRPGIDGLRKERRGARKRLFFEAVAHWQDLEKRKTWKKLATTINAVAEKV